MGATNKTPNLELPQFIGTDKPSWLGDFNGAMTAIDAGYGKQSGDISAAATAAQTAKTTADAAQEASAANTTSIQQLTSEMSDVMGDISGLEADVNQINNKLNAIQNIEMKYLSAYCWSGNTWNDTVACRLIKATYNGIAIYLMAIDAKYHSNLVYSGSGTLATLRLTGNLFSMGGASVPYNTPTTITTHAQYRVTRYAPLNGQSKASYSLKMFYNSSDDYTYICADLGQLNGSYWVEYPIIHDPTTTATDTVYIPN